MSRRPVIDGYGNIWIPREKPREWSYFCPDCGFEIPKSRLEQHRCPKCGADMVQEPA